MKLNKREMTLVLLTAAVLVAAFVLMPLAGVWSARQVQIKDLRAKVDAGQKLVNHENILRSRWGGMQTNAQIFYLHLPRRPLARQRHEDKSHRHHRHRQQHHGHFSFVQFHSAPPLLNLKLNTNWIGGLLPRLCS